MRVKCNKCKADHQFNASEMAAILEEMQEGTGHVVTHVIPDSKVQETGHVRTEIVSRCTKEVVGDLLYATTNRQAGRHSEPAI